MSTIISVVGVLTLLILIPSLYLIFRRGSKQPENSEDKDLGSEVKFTSDEVSDVVETTFEILEEEHLQDEEFENKVIKLESDISVMSDTDVANYINGFFGVSPDDNPITCTDDQSKFEWERDSSSDTECNSDTNS